MSLRATEVSAPSLAAGGGAPRESEASPPLAAGQRGAPRASIASATFLAASAVLAAATVTPERGEVALALMLRKLATVGTVMHVTAHPDDETNGLMAMQSRGQGLRVVLATATRGNGGQNEIGPEIFEALGVLRTEELLAAHRFDGAEQFFTRAVDFGFSFSIDETFEKWGKDEILGDYVRLIRIDAAGRDVHDAPRRRRRRPAPSGVRASRPRRVPRGRRPDALPEQLAGPARLAAEEDLPGRAATASAASRRRPA